MARLRVKGRVLALLVAGNRTTGFLAALRKHLPGKVIHRPL